MGRNLCCNKLIINVVNTIIIRLESNVNNSSQDAPRYYVDMHIELNEVMDLDHTIEKRAFMDITDQQGGIGNKVLNA
jgi:hypothetical protein